MSQGNTAATPGQLLREARLARGCDLAAAHEGTKIAPRLLEALERDEYHQVSDQLYVKSFLRNYASWLGLDPQAVLRLYEQVAGELGDAGEPGGPVWSEDQVTVKRVGAPWARYLWAAAAVVVAAALIWLIWLRGDGRTTTPVREIPVVSALSQDGPGSGSGSEAAAEAIAPTVPPAATDTAATAAAATTRPAADLPAAVRGDPRLRFAGGATHELVLRLRLPAGANCSVRSDGQAAAAPLIWPEEVLPLPAYNLRPGVAYAVRDGYVAYWGAADHFTLTLDELRDVEVTLNGRTQPVQAWRPGQPVLLDRSRLDAAGGGP